MAITPTSTVEYSPQSSSSWTSQSTSIASPVLRRIQKTLPRSITFTETATGSATNFTDGGSEHHSQMIHRVTLTDLTPNTPYVYHCGDKSTGWSSVFTFTSMPSGPAWSPRFAVYGDLGDVNSQSLAYLQEEVQEGHFDAVLHVGDFAYDLDTDNAARGDDFMNDIQSIAAYVPYMTCPGNHESAYNFSNYINRFSMPANDNLYFSFNVANIHFVSFSTEIYFSQLNLLAEQFKWLINDLAIANMPENRLERPWIIAFGHRPMYCSNADHDDCTEEKSRIRLGVANANGTYEYGLENLFYENGVDLLFFAHEHSYERLLPVYNEQLYNTSITTPYTDPRAPVHIISGSSGCQEDHDKFGAPQGPWSVYRSEDYGYGRLQVYNNTHLHWEQVSDASGGGVIDEIWLVQHKHGPFGRAQRTRVPVWLRGVNQLVDHPEDPVLVRARARGRKRNRAPIID